jgi:hypothetical protein
VDILYTPCRKWVSVDSASSSSGAAKYQALPITPPQDAGDVFLTWQGTSEYPDLGNFPAPDDRVGISDQGWNDVMLEL